MGLAWVPDDVGSSAPPEPGRDWPPRARHRRPTRLSRRGQAAGRLTAAGGGDVGLGAIRRPAAQVVRRAALPGRRYWT